jgi:hypothetical protein
MLDYAELLSSSIVGVSPMACAAALRVTPPDSRHMDIRQANNLRLNQKLARLGIEVAYPTLTLFVAPIFVQETA